MSHATRKPTHRLVRYYGTGKNAPRAEVGALWKNEDGSYSIRLDTLGEQVWINAFAIKEKTAGGEA